MNSRLSSYINIRLLSVCRSVFLTTWHCILSAGHCILSAELKRTAFSAILPTG